MTSSKGRGRLNLLSDAAGLLVFALCASPVFMPLVLFSLGFYTAALMWLLMLLLFAAGLAFFLRRKISKRRIAYTDVGPLQRSPM
jgi:VIT1/CCC1 family predicted Fe2+/Mn2+ transporter